MYTPRGQGLSELGDIEVVVGDDGRLHLFHLTLPNHDVVQHAVSDDGLHWEPLPNALHTGDPGDPDDDQIWTMSVTKVGDEWRMLYTALSRHDDGMVQRTGMATSRDLVHWTKSARNPVAEADPRWYEADISHTGSVSWRDPKAVRVGNEWWATVDAREATGPVMRRGCVGLMTSRDFDLWTVEPPLFAPRGWWDLECPQLFSIGEHWYLTSAIMEDRAQRYWMADNPKGPFRTPSDGGVLAPSGHYAGRVTQWGEAHLLFCWHQSRLADGWQSTSRTIDWVSPRNPFGKHLVPPLMLRQRADGSLMTTSFHGWEKRLDMAVDCDPRPASAFHQVPTDRWHLECPGNVDQVVSVDAHGDGELLADIRMTAPRGGIAFRTDEDGGGWYLEYIKATGALTLSKWVPTEDAREHRRGYRWEELQRRVVPGIIDYASYLSFRIVFFGPYVEVSVNGEVVLATLTGERSSGPVGLWVDSGKIAARMLQFRPMRPA